MGYGWTKEEYKKFISQITAMAEEVCHKVIKFSRECKAEIKERKKTGKEESVLWRKRNR